MSIRLACPSCAHKFSLSKQQAMGVNRCPSCGVSIDISEKVAKKLAERQEGVAAKSARPDSSAAGTERRSTGRPSTAPQVGKGVEDKAIADTKSTAGKPNTGNRNTGAARKQADRPLPVAKPLNQQAAGPPAAEAGMGRVPREPASIGARTEDPRRNRLRTKKAPLPKLYIFGAAGASLVLVAIVAVVLMIVNGGGPERDSGDDTDSPNAADLASGGEAGSGTSVSGATAADSADSTSGDLGAPSLTDEQLAKIWREVQSATVKLSIDGPGGTTEGWGFVVDSRGWIVTALHLIEGAKSAQVRFSVDRADGKTEECLGLVASSKSDDLAILSVGAPAVRISIPLELDAQWQATSGEPVAVARPPATGGSWLSACSVSGTVDESTLPADSRAMARERGTDVGAGWIAFQGELAGSLGSGSPLLNKRGRVVGMNVELGPASASGYAVPCARLADLLRAAEGAEPVPLDQDDQVASAAGTDDRGDDSAPGDDTNTAPPMPDEPPGDTPPSAVDPPTSVPPKSPPATSGAVVTAAEINELSESCQGVKWLPTDEKQYADHQRLAERITKAFHPDHQNAGSDEDRRKAQEAADEVLRTLSKVAWADDAQLTAVNELAAREFKKSQVGLFAYCEALGRQSNVAAVGGRDIVLLKFRGVEEYIVLPVKQGSEHFASGTQWLVMGIPQLNKIFQIRLNDLNVNAMVIEGSHVLQKPREPES